MFQISFFWVKLHPPLPPSILKNVTPSFPATPLLKLRSSQAPLFWKLVRRFYPHPPPPPSAERGEGVHTMVRMVLEIYPIEFSLFWGVHNIGRPLEMSIATFFYVCNYLHWIPIGMKIGKSIVFEVGNQKMKVITLKNIRF